MFSSLFFIFGHGRNEVRVIKYVKALIYAQLTHTSNKLKISLEREKTHTCTHLNWNIGIHWRIYIKFLDKNLIQPIWLILRARRCRPLFLKTAKRQWINWLSIYNENDGITSSVCVCVCECVLRVWECAVLCQCNVHKFDFIIPDNHHWTQPIYKLSNPKPKTVIVFCRALFFCTASIVSFAFFPVAYTTVLFSTQFSFYYIHYDALVWFLRREKEREKERKKMDKKTKTKKFVWRVKRSDADWLVNAFKMIFSRQEVPPLLCCTVHSAAITVAADQPH